LSSNTIFALLLQGLGLGLSAAATPGPFQTYLINQTLTKGWRQALPIAFAPLISDIPIVIIILLVLDHLPSSFLRWVGLAGGIFVLFLAWGLFRTWRADPEVRSPRYEQPPPRSALLNGILMNALSPGPYTFWALVNGPILLSAIRQSWLHGTAFLLGFYGMMISGYLLIIALFHLARQLGPGVVRTLTLLSIILLVLFGGILLRQALWV
jgi:threonine/homoserine/homoserine lactone efflux protein